MAHIPSDNRGFVATMGALHEGHLELVRQSQSACSETVLSIFVNPLQFGPNEDFSRYPRPEERDLSLAEASGVDIAFLPTAEEMYSNSRTIIQVLALRDILEGAIRPGHFDGVATIVAKLLHIVQPHTAYFGLKDLQQCSVLYKMVVDLCIPTKLKFVETIREEDGLALSSRNQYLSQEERKLAPNLSLVLRRVAQELTELNSSHGDAIQILNIAQTELTELGFKVDYLTAVDAKSFETWSVGASGGRVVAAARLGSTRLLDNFPIGSDPTFSS